LKTPNLTPFGLIFSWEKDPDEESLTCRNAGLCYGMGFVSGPEFKWGRQPTGFEGQLSRGITKSDGWATCQ